MMTAIRSLACGLLFVPSVVYGAEAEQADQGKKVIGVMLDQYATIGGAWYLEKKCHFLGDDLRKQWEADIASCTVRLHKNIGVAHEMLDQMQQAGKETATTYPCDEKSRDIVVQTILMAKKLSMALISLDKNPDESSEKN